MYAYTYIGRDNGDIAYLLLEDKGSNDAPTTGDADIQIVDMTEGDKEEGPERKRRKHTPYQTIAVKPVCYGYKQVRQASKSSSFSSENSLINRQPLLQLRKRHRLHYRVQQRRYQATSSHPSPTHSLL
jgi:hypothetical protein